jgi:hypothetical protein
MAPSGLSKWKSLLKQGLVLTVYMTVWFCALIFYDKDALGITGSTYIGYGFALLKALLLSKFMLAAHAISPIKYRPGLTLYSLIVLRSIFNAIVVLIFSYLFAGIEGIFKHQGFIESILSFCDGNIGRILALTLMYWLIVLPYVSYRCLGEAMGQENLQSYLSGNNANRGM